MKRLLVILIGLAMVMSGCAMKNNKSEKKITTNNQKKEVTIKLTEEESLAYERFKKDLKQEDLKSLPPLSIAKIFGQALLEKRYDVQYELYSNISESSKLTAEEYKNLPVSKKITTSQIEKVFGNINNGKFDSITEKEGMVVTNVDIINKEVVKTGIFMSKDENEGWRVNYLSKSE